MKSINFRIVFSLILSFLWGGSLHAIEEKSSKENTHPFFSNKIVHEGDRVQLNATQLFGPDGGATLYMWRQISGPVIPLKNPKSPVCTFEAPLSKSNAPVMAAFEVVGVKLSEKKSDIVYVMMEHKNRPPRPAADRFFSAKPNELVSLNASTTTDPDGDRLDYLWTQTSGPLVLLSNPIGKQTYFSAPSWSQSDRGLTMYCHFQLVATDPYGLVSTMTTETGISQPYGDFMWANMSGEEVKKINDFEHQRMFQINSERGYRLENDLKKAKELMEKKLYAQVIDSVTEILMYRSDNEEAIQLLTRARAIMREDFELQLKAAKEAFLKKDYFSALKDLSMARDLRKDDPEEKTYTEVCLLALDQQANVDFEVKLIQYAAQPNPDVDVEKSRSLYGQGVMMYAQGRYDDARDTWGKALAFNPDNRLAANAYNRLVGENAER